MKNEVSGVARWSALHKGCRSSSLGPAAPVGCVIVCFCEVVVPRPSIGRSFERIFEPPCGSIELIKVQVVQWRRKVV